MSKFPEWFINELAHEEDKQNADSLRATDYVDFVCPKHGIYNQKISSHIRISDGKRKIGCKYCLKKEQIRKSLETKASLYSIPQWFIDGLVDEKDKQLAKDKKLKSHDKVRFKCDKHRLFVDEVCHIIKFSTGERVLECPLCRKGMPYYKDSKSMYPQWFIDELYSEEDKLRALDNNISSSEFVYFNCNKHGKYRQQVTNHIKLSTGEVRCKCPKCIKGRYSSSLEKTVREFIDLPCVRNTRGYIKRNGIYQELDMYYEDRKIAIEVNGSKYHQSSTIIPFGKETLFPKDKYYHQDKFKLCEELGIHLVSIFDKDWIQKKEAVKRYLTDLFYPGEVIYARKCEVKQIGIRDARIFCNQYHIQGASNLDSEAWGIFYKNELISVITYGKSRYGKEGWELY